MKQLPIHDIIEWDVLNWTELIDLWSPIIDKFPKTAKVLTVGERNGGLSLWLTLKGYNVVCTDVIDAMQNAAGLHEKYSIADNITYKDLDIVHGRMQEQFDIILLKSVIGGLKEDRQDARTRNFLVQKKAVLNMYSMLKPGGVLLAAENIQGNILIRLFRSMKNKSKGWRYLKYRELKELFGTDNILEIKTFGILPSSFSTGVINKVTYRINKIFDFLPSNTKYIAFVAAKKN